MTPLEKIAHMKVHYNKEMSALLRRASVLPGLPRSVEYKIHALIEVVDGIAAIAGKYGPCRKGCSVCCYQSVVISTWEADRIQKASGKPLTNFKGYHPRQDMRNVLVGKFTGQRCPFLVDKVCSVYDVRPMMCRTHLSLADDSFPCDIINNFGAEVPYFDFEDMRQLVAILYIEGGYKFGDIREFFGDVDGQTD